MLWAYSHTVRLAASFAVILDPPVHPNGGFTGAVSAGLLSLTAQGQTTLAARCLKYRCTDKNDVVCVSGRSR